MICQGSQGPVKDQLINEFWRGIEHFIGGLPPTKGSFIYWRDKYEREKLKRKKKRSLRFKTPRA